MDANPSALKITGILENSLKINLFDFPLVLKREKLIGEGFIKFQSPLEFEKIKNSGLYTPTKSGKSFIDFTVSVINSGFLMQIQEITPGEKYEALFQSEEKYRRFFEDDLTGDFIATSEGRIMECNPAFAEIYGFFSMEKALQSDISKFNTFDWKNLIKRLEIEHKVQGHQTTHKRPDGKQIHVIANVVGIFDDSGELIQVKGYVFDDTERKKAEEALKESEKKYHRLFDEDLTGDFIATPKGQILECNPAFAEIYAFDDCELALQWNISQSNPFDWPYMVTRLKKECKLQSFQSWQRRSDGMRIHVVANMVGIFDDSGELIQVKGYVFDDTERKKAEDALDNSKNQITEILDSIQDGFIALNHNWHFIYVNRSAGEYFGIDPEDLIGQNLWEKFPEFLGAIYETSLRRAMENEEIQHFEAPGMHTTDKYFDFSVYPFSDGISIYWRDITMYKKLEEKLRQAHDQ